MLEQVSVREYVALKSPPLEGMINWKLHNLAIVPGVTFPRLVLASGVHLFIFILLYVKPVKRCLFSLGQYQHLSDQK